MLAAIGRGLAVRGEALFVLDVDDAGGLTLTQCVVVGRGRLDAP